MDTAAQFFAAARELAKHTGSLQERLADAYADHLLVVTSQDLPAELQPSFRELEERLNTDDPQGNEDDDPIEAAARNLTDAEAQTLIDCILVLYGRLASTAPRGG
jgi:predicted DNA binding protein